MKKLSIKIAVCAIILTTFTFSCSKDENSNNIKESSNNELLARGSTSDELKLDSFANYLISQNLLSNANIISIDRNKSFIERVENIDVLVLFVNNDSDGGTIRGIKTSENGKNMIPLNKEYLIIYEKYSNLNEARNSLTIESYDWNYNKKFYELEVDNSIKIKEDFFPILDNPVISVVNGLPSSCRGGEDGNISWGECMNCSTIVCGGDPTCNSICSLVNKLTYIYHLVGGWAGLSGCTATLGIGCIAVAIAF